ncbi:5'/3'-nucleotidase SurE [Emergomyces africanus]|uniref:5'/3'-nucleotidase SurE n=1 Tax=Emergomyces africanus TaxID=1955775 RepID=A0A1B7NQ29_9EURO|nr:5'/3'-nucleotidase SurE [Emergomyces africanus]
MHILVLAVFFTSAGGEAKIDTVLVSVRVKNLADWKSSQVVNDDGPPSQKCSPYLFPFVKALGNAGHLVSVVIPSSSRSWIGKAHIIGETLKATYISPEALLEDSGASAQSNHDQNDVRSNGLSTPSNKHGRSTSSSTPGSDLGRLWVVVNGTPAACTQLGLYCLFPDREPIDLVISGPNHGRNASTIYGLASGTVGGALEAATCGKKAIALSFASKDKQPAETIQAAARISVKLIEHLSAHWPDEGVELYSVNVPMRSDVEKRPIVYTSMLQNFWSKSSLYREVDLSASQPANNSNNSKDDRAWGDEVSPTESGVLGQRDHLQQTKYFQWAPELSDIQRSVEMSQVGTDTCTVMNGCTSVTPLSANFSHVSSFSGELRL